MKKLVILVVGLMMISGVAYADSFAGTVTKVDTQSQTLSFTRSDNGQEAVVKVDDPTALGKLKVGGSVQVEATKDASGNWTATSVMVPNA